MIDSPYPWIEWSPYGGFESRFVCITEPIFKRIVYRYTCYDRTGYGEQVASDRIRVEIDDDFAKTNCTIAVFISIGSKRTAKPSRFAVWVYDEWWLVDEPHTVSDIVNTTSYFNTHCQNGLILLPKSLLDKDGAAMLEFAAVVYKS